MESLCKKRHHKIMHLVLCHIIEVEKRKLFLTLGYESMYKYLTHELGYAEDAAYDRMQAARVLKSVPSLTEKLQEGSINLTQLVKVNQCLKLEKKLGHVVTSRQTEELIAKIENKTNFETEKVLAKELGHTPKQYQKIKPQADDSVRADIAFSKEDFEIIKEAQSLYSHVIVENDLGKALAYFARKAVEHKKGKTQKPEEKVMSKAQAQTTQSFSLKPEISSIEKSETQRKYLSVHVKRAVLAKANYCCEHIHPETKRKCNSKFQLQIDHIKPLAKGGTDAIENLRVLCGVHNRFEALRWGLWGPH